MTEIERLQDQIRRSYEGEAWHGPPLRELIGDVDAATAAARPIADAHTIWELVLHITAWQDAARRRLEGDPAHLTDEEDWPPVLEVGDEAWSDTLAALDVTHRRLTEAVGGLTQAGLYERVIEQEHSVYELLHGVVQHDLYHAGQIALLKKMIATTMRE
jgi:uncharacterized damage-inducible protein DinB